MDISIPDPLRAWVEAQVASGHYEGVEAYVGDLIRRDRPPLLDHEALVDALVAGEESGISARRVPDIMADLAARASSPLFRARPMRHLRRPR